MALLADELHDLRVDQDRQIQIGSDGDLEQTSGVETIEQSVMLEVGDEVKPLIGEPIDGPTLEDIQSSIRDVLRRDPQLESVRRVEITEVNLNTSTVSVSVFVENNNEFSIEVDL